MCVVLMGCVNSKKDGALRPNLFQVVNVDDYGNPVNPGQLEVTETELVFYQQGRTPVRWPLCTLRRYGCDTDHFSFESGRRSPTGPGIYAFLCHRAEQIVALLEIRLQPVRPRFLDSDPPDHPNNQNHPRISQRLSSITSLGPLSPSSPLSEAPPPPITNVNRPLYANDEPQPSPDEANNNKPQEHTYTNTILGAEALLSPPTPGHLYMNIVPGTDSLVPVPPTLAPAQPPYVAAAEEEEELEEDTHCYANLDLEGPLNYIVLDLNSSSSEQPVPESPKKTTPSGYATIDFDRTAALSHSVNPSFENDCESSRKTRHNSTFCDAVSRHQSTASD